MDKQWLSDAEDFDEFILAGDIGGTNTTIALVGRKDRNFTILAKFRFRSQKIDGLETPIRTALEEIRTERGVEPRKCCLSGAGPVKNNYCTLSNVTWRIDGGSLEEHLGIRTIVINDFMAVSYGLSLLDVNDPTQITKLPHTDGSLPAPHGNIKAVVGAGTGLGVGYLTEHRGTYIAYASEGGHSDFFGYDPLTHELAGYLEKRWGKTPGGEAFVSGQGIANIYHFFRDVKKLPLSGALREVEAVDDHEKPAIISRYAREDEHCREIMDLFISLYGKFAANAALFYFPTGGMYLAGGIVTKNERLFLEDHLFMKHFETNYRQHIAAALKTFPVYLIKDYSVSLYGAAQAAYSLL